MDLFKRCYEYKRVEEAKAMGIYPYFRALSSAPDNVVTMEGGRKIMLGSNNYLGLTTDRRTKDAAIAAVEQYGTGCSGSRFLNGTLTIHLELERALADFLQKDDCIIFSTGFQSNLSIISAITDRNDVILTDSMNHASIVDGTRLSFARTIKYRHNDMEDLERLLKKHAEETRGGILVITDGVFSMEGEICNLPEIVRLKKKYNARLLIDDAHAIGVLGDHGRGTAEHFGLTEDVDLIMNTFSKTLASLGGCVVGETKVIEYIRHTARPFIFSASIPPAQVAAARRSLEILIEEPWRVARLHEIAAYMREKLSALPHIRLHDSGNTLVPIIPIKTGTVMCTLKIANELFAAGVYVNSVLPPAVAEEDCLLRTSFTATHTNEQLDEAAEIIGKVFTEFADDPFCAGCLP
ncbi:MAG TPA: pyridoxal phosphate-dependent aminotransferase family protein [Clostridiaceae bacterium]|jgi:8-amino-7-oxononanoate synthase|nr:pyridoxal phosphate-dependent aminotransferase family protein [Clostridiaceae bacterium]